MTKTIVMCTLLSIFVITAMWRTAIWLSDPVGDDHVDYDMDLDLRNLWEESLETLEHMTPSSASGADDTTERVLKHALYHTERAEMAKANPVVAERGHDEPALPNTPTM